MMTFEYEKDFSRVDDNKMERDVYDMLKRGEYASM